MAICYRDKTFCNAPCTNTACYRRLTDDARSGARRWWNHDPDNAPIAVSDFSPGCSEYVQEPKP